MVVTLKMQNQKLIIAYDIGSVDWIDISIYMLHYLGLYFYIGKVLYLLFKIWKDLDILLTNYLISARRHSREKQLNQAL